MNYQFYGTEHGYRTPSPQPPYPADPTAPQYVPPSPVYGTHDLNRLSSHSFSLPYPTDGEPSSPLSPVYRAAPTYWAQPYTSTTPPPPPTPPQQFQYYDHAVSPQYQYQYSQCNGRRKVCFTSFQNSMLTCRHF